MATLMQKDVIIEAVSDATAFVALRLPVEDIMSNPTMNEVKRIRRYVYRTDPEDLNYREMMDTIKALKQQIAHLPVEDLTTKAI